MAETWTHPKGLFPLTMDYERELIAGTVIRKACEYDATTGRMYLTCSVGELAQRAVIALADQTDTQRLDWWFAHGMDDSVCEGSVDLWWATEVNGDAATVVTHGTSVRDTIDKAMQGIHDFYVAGSAPTPETPE
jgi:hypothetical protein